jgi:alpha-tubulin suppressor-like RCC1 family protein
MVQRMTQRSFMAPALLLTVLPMTGCNKDTVGPQPEPQEMEPSLEVQATPATRSHFDVYRGSGTSVGLRVTRVGFRGPVTVEVEELPQGVRAARLVIPENATFGLLELLTSLEAPEGYHKVNLMAAGAAGVAASSSVRLRVLPTRRALELAGAPGLRLAAGSDHTCYLRWIDGFEEDPYGPWPAFCWGRNDRGQVGDGTLTDAFTPTQISGRFIQIVAGANHTCALEGDGSAVCWGANDQGQLGDGGHADRTERRAVQGGHTFRMLAAGGAGEGPSHTCGLDRSGGALCWGANGSGQLGTGDTEASAVPVPVAVDRRFIQLVAGRAHTCGLDEESRAWCWGDNALGQLGSQDGHATVPTEVVGGLQFVSLSASGDHTCGFDSSRGALCWGANGSGQLGTGDTGASAVPVPVLSDLPTGTPSAGESHTCAGFVERYTELGAIGRTYCWGLNDAGQLGDGTTERRSAPVAVGATSPPVFWARDPLALGGSHSCAFGINGVGSYGIGCWGDNSRGQLGIGAGVNRSLLPLEVRFHP